MVVRLLYLQNYAIECGRYATKQGSNKMLMTGYSSPDRLKAKLHYQRK